MINGVINGVTAGIRGELAAWKIDKVHVWNYVPEQGLLTNGFYSTAYGCTFIGCQVDCDTGTVPYRVEGTDAWYKIIGCNTLVEEGADGVGTNVTVGTGSKLVAVGNTIANTSSAKNFATDFSGDLTKFIGIGNISDAVVTPTPWENEEYYVATTSAQLTIGTTYTDITGLALPLAANTAYEFEFNIIADADATTTGIDVTCNGPASPTSVKYTVEYWTSATAMGFVGAGTYAFDTANGNSCGASQQIYRVSGVVRNGANAGDLTAQIKREAVGSGPNVRTGSWGRLRRLARPI
jgi:hypothetical protein